MTDKTGIEWTDATWNPVTGCDKVSPGCDHCYAETIAHRFAGTKAYPDGFAVTLRPERLDQPLRWKRPRRIFVNSMSDLFHKDIPDEFIARVWAVMALAPQHTFQILTKRHGRMRSLLRSDAFKVATFDAAWELSPGPLVTKWPLSNVWMGVSVEDQQRAELRIPALLDTPAAVRFLSCEPLLGPVDLTGSGTAQTYWLTGRPGWGEPETANGVTLSPLVVAPGIDWVIVGGESGPGARPMHPEWARQLRDQCTTAGVAFHFKQWGEWVPDEWIDEDGARHVGPKPTARDPKTLVMHAAGMTALTPDNPFDPWERGHPHWHTVMKRVGKKAAGRELDGRTWDEYPADERTPA
jgi:Bacteriophage protein gp37